MSRSYVARLFDCLMVRWFDCFRPLVLEFSWIPAQPEGQQSSNLTNTLSTLFNRQLSHPVLDSLNNLFRMFS